MPNCGTLQVKILNPYQLSLFVHHSNMIASFAHLFNYSDGIGRTGTYCLIDMVLNRLSKGAKEIDIAATLEHIRDQRGGSVKSKLQFKFVFTAIAEEVSAILKTLKP